MESATLHFDREAAHKDFRTREYASTICAEGLYEYVDLPKGILDIDVVFTDYKPDGDDSFKIIFICGPDVYGLDTESTISWYDNSRAVLKMMHDSGYRYITIKYVP